jgi:hypothetical protein
MHKKHSLLCGHRSDAGGLIRLDLTEPIQKLPLMKRPGYELLVATVAALRRHAKCAYPVVVRSGGVPNTMDGFCIRRKTRFVIHLDSILRPSQAVSVLVHEWAHARAWNHYLDRASQDAAEGAITSEEFDAICHGPAFGVEYAHCWRVFTGVVLPGLKQRVGVARAG